MVRAITMLSYLHFEKYSYNVYFIVNEKPIEMIVVEFYQVILLHESKFSEKIRRLKKVYLHLRQTFSAASYYT